MFRITTITSKVEGEGIAYPLMVVTLMMLIFAMNSLLITLHTWHVFGHGFWMASISVCPKGS